MLNHLFSNKIIDRGRDYFYQHNVTHLSKIDNVYRAVVEGEKNYEVCIEVNDQNKVKSMKCTCPYALDGKNCKHEVAVLMEIYGEKEAFEDTYNEDYFNNSFYDDEEENEEYDDDDYDILCYQEHEILSRLERKNKKEILEIIKTAVRDEQTYQSISKAIDEKDAYKDVSRYIDTCLSRFNKKRNLDILMNKIEALRHYNNKIEDIKLIESAVKKAVDNIKQMNNKEKDFVFMLLKNLEQYYQEGETHKIVDEFIYSLCIYYEHPIVYDIIIELKRRNYPLNHIIEEMEKNMRFALDKKKYMKKYFFLVMHCAGMSLDKVISENYDDINFKFALIDYYMEMKLYAKAIKVCLDGINQNQNFDFYLKLIQIDKLTNNRDKLAELYKKILKYRKPGQIEYYHELKKLYTTTQWEIEKKKIIKEMEKKHINLCNIYLEEKMYNHLLGYFIKTKDMLLVKKYEDELFKHLPKETSDFYEKYIYEALQTTGNREFYQEVATYIQAIERYDSPRGVKIRFDLTIKYPKRSAMIDEINK